MSLVNKCDRCGQIYTPPIVGFVWSARPRTNKDLCFPCRRSFDSWWKCKAVEPLNQDSMDTK